MNADERIRQQVKTHRAAGPVRVTRDEFTPGMIVVHLGAMTQEISLFAEEWAKVISAVTAELQESPQ